MSSLIEIQEAVSALPHEERRQLVDWLNASFELSEARKVELIREVQIGIDQAERGELVPFDMMEIMQNARAIHEGRKHR